MVITEKQLRALIHGHIVGDIGDVDAYKNGSRNLVKGFLRETVDELRSLSRLFFEVEQDSYGSGYASYWDVFCSDKANQLMKNPKEAFCRDGISLYLCQLVPVAVLGASNMVQSQNTKSYGFMRPENVDQLPPDKWYWSQLVAKIRARLEKRGFILPSQKFLRQPLPFATRVPTIIGDPPYTMFDAFFCWED